MRMSLQLKTFVPLCWAELQVNVKKETFLWRQGQASGLLCWWLFWFRHDDWLDRFGLKSVTEQNTAEHNNTCLCYWKPYLSLWRLFHTTEHAGFSLSFTVRTCLKLWGFLTLPLYKSLPGQRGEDKLDVWSWGVLVSAWLLWQELQASLLSPW